MAVVAQGAFRWRSRSNEVVRVGPQSRSFGGLQRRRHRAVPLEERAQRKGHPREDKGPTAGLEEAPRKPTPPTEDRDPGDDSSGSRTHTEPDSSFGLCRWDWGPGWPKPVSEGTGNPRATATRPRAATQRTAGKTAHPGGRPSRGEGASGARGPSGVRARARPSAI